MSVSAPTLTSQSALFLSTSSTSSSSASSSSSSDANVPLAARRKQRMIEGELRRIDDTSDTDEPNRHDDDVATGSSERTTSKPTKVRNQPVVLEAMRNETTRKILAQTAHVHTRESFRWTALNSADFERTILETPYITTQVVCRVSFRRNAPSPECISERVKDMIDWETLLCTPLGPKMLKSFENDTFKGSIPRDVRYHVDPVATTERAILWIGSIFVTPVSGGVQGSVAVYRADVTDLPSLIQ